MMTIGERLRFLRKRKGVTGDEVADFIGVTRPQYTAYESGRQNPTRHISKLADYFQVSTDYLCGKTDSPSTHNQRGRKIPVLGTVPAGIPLEAITDIIDYEEIPQNMVGEYFALKIKGNSMSPRICDGDVVIVKKESSVDSGDIAIVIINGNEATCKEVKIQDNGIALIGWNVAEWSPLFFTREEAESLPVRIIGRVVEVRIKNLKRQ